MLQILSFSSDVQHTHTHTHTHTHVCVCKYVCTHIYTHVHPHTHTNKHIHPPKVCMKLKHTNAQRLQTHTHLLTHALIIKLGTPMRPTNRIALPWVHIWAIDDILSQFMHVPRGDRLGVGQLSGKHHWHPNLVGVDARVWGDDWPSSIVDTFSHHVHAEQPFLFLQQLKAVCSMNFFFFSSVPQLESWRTEVRGKREGGGKGDIALVNFWPAWPFFFFCVPQLDLWGSPFQVRFLRMWTFFSPTIEVVGFHLCGWWMLGVFSLPASTRLGHEHQDLLSLCDGMHVYTD